MMICKAKLSKCSLVDSILKTQDSDPALETFESVVGKFKFNQCRLDTTFLRMHASTEKKGRPDLVGQGHLQAVDQLTNSSSLDLPGSCVMQLCRCHQHAFYDRWKLGRQHPAFHQRHCLKHKLGVQMQAILDSWHAM